MRNSLGLRHPSRETRQILAIASVLVAAFARLTSILPESIEFGLVLTSTLLIIYYVGMNIHEEEKRKRQSDG